MPDDSERPENLDSGPEVTESPECPESTKASVDLDGGDVTADRQTEDGAEPASSREPVDALGEVEEQERLPEEQSTIPRPGEALEDLLPALEATGHEGVDDALATLEDMADKSVHDHVEVFDAVHEELRRTLDQAPEH